MPPYSQLPTEDPQEAQLQLHGRLPAVGHGAGIFYCCREIFLHVSQRGFNGVRRQPLIYMLNAIKNESILTKYDMRQEKARPK